MLCDNCGTEKSERELFHLAALFTGVASANAGESGSLCSKCLKTQRPPTRVAHTVSSQRHPKVLDRYLICANAGEYHLVGVAAVRQKPYAAFRRDRAPRRYIFEAL